MEAKIVQLNERLLRELALGNNLGVDVFTAKNYLQLNETFESFLRGGQRQRRHRQDGERPPQQACLRPGAKLPACERAVKAWNLKSSEKF